MLDLLKQKNPELTLYSVQSVAFETYGRVIESLGTNQIIETAKNRESSQRLCLCRLLAGIGSAGY